MFNRHFFVATIIFFSIILVSLLVIIGAGVFGDYAPSISGGGAEIKKIFKF